MCARLVQAQYRQNVTKVSEVLGNGTMARHGHVRGGEPNLVRNGGACNGRHDVEQAVPFWADLLSSTGGAKHGPNVYCLLCHGKTACSASCPVYECLA